MSPTPGPESDKWAGTWPGDQCLGGREREENWPWDWHGERRWIQELECDG